MKDVINIFGFVLIIVSWLACVTILCIKHPPGWGWVVIATMLVVGSIKMKTGG